jgi:hypothetical protein
LTVDSTGHLIVSNTFSDQITEYPSTGSGGNESPTAVIYGVQSELSFPLGADVDAGNRLYVANELGGLDVFAAGANGLATPQAVIGGSATGLSAPQAVAVSPPMTIVSSALPVAARGRRYSANLYQVLGKRPVHWRVIHGHLPAGVHLSRTGHLSGVPLRVGTYHLTVRVTDSSAHRMTDKAAVTLTVISPPVITAVSPGHGGHLGGTLVTIVGRGFSTRPGSTIVYFGHVPARAVHCASSKRCTVRTVRHSKGDIRVSAVVGGIKSPPASAAVYRYR